MQYSRDGSAELEEQAASSGSGVTLPMLQFGPGNSESIWLLLGRGGTTDLASPPSCPKQGRMILVGLEFFFLDRSSRREVRRLLGEGLSCPSSGLFFCPLPLSWS